MKILAYSNTGTGYHRVERPLKDKAVFKTTFDDEDFEDIDVFNYNSRCCLMPFQLNLLRKKYGFKIIVDIDDYWILNPSHPRYQYYKDNDIPYFIIQNMVNADMVTTPSEYLAQKIKEYNPHVYIIPNALNSYDYTSEETGRVRFLFIGTTSHNKDMELLINPMKRCRHFGDFIFAGSPEGGHEMVNRFKPDKTLPILPIDSYLSFFSQADVVLAPLEDNEFNRCKSNLRLLEAASHGLPVICSDVEPYKETLFKVSKQEQWYNHINYLTYANRKEIGEIGRAWAKENYDFDKINNLRMEVFNLPAPKVKKTAKIYSICFEKTEVEYDLYINTVKTIEEKSYLFEYNPILKLLPDMPDEYVGFFSWKFPFKSIIAERDIYKFMSENTADVYNFCSAHIPKEKYLENSEFHHKGILNLLEQLCSHLEIPFTKDIELIYSNFFIMKTSYYKEFGELLKRAISILDNELKALAWQDANYKGYKDIKEKTGLAYYPFHPFVLERLAPMWIKYKGLTVANYFTY